MNPTKSLLAGVALVSSLAATLWSVPANAQWAPKKAALMTRFASQVDPKNPLPEYPRPQFVRSRWQSLNGIWQFQPGQEGDRLPTQRKLSGQICVPFPVESALSGVMKHHDRLWYRRTFIVPKAWKNKTLMLNFGAVDYESEVFVNGKSVGVHTGGYEQFSYDISRFLKGRGPQELIVRVFDPTDKGGQPRGKQTLTPQGIMYTPTTGIWQTVWMEPVAPSSITDVHMVPDVDKSQIRIRVNTTNTAQQGLVTAKIKDLGRVVKVVELRPNVETAISIPNPRLWSPESPALYSVDFSLRQDKLESDRVSSYFGMRKISVGMSDGVPKLLLNNRFVFQFGPLDQGYWPDGNLTAPTDEALRYDLVATKQLGFNMTRKHIKVEPARWYYHADKLGLLVWQDMPSPNSYTGNAPPIDKAAFAKQMTSIITSHWNSPSIVMWVIFNERQARHDTASLVGMAKALDPSRLVNRDSGGGNETEDSDVGDVDDVHSYPPPAGPNPSETQALVCGEYGGIGLIVPGHTWQDRANWGYTTINTAPELENLYGEFAGQVKDLRDRRNLSAAVYTQITDVEIESNGLLTYDRLMKANPKEIALATNFRYPLPTYLPVVETSERAPQSWKYTFTAPPSDWISSGFDDATWQTGQAAFGGGKVVDGTPIGTEWSSNDIWMRKTFDPGELSAQQIEQLVVRSVHDDGLDVWVNGVPAFKANNAISRYENKTMSPEAKRAIKLNAPNVLAVHCVETGGDQYVDVGLYLRVPAPGRK